MSRTLKGPEEELSPTRQVSKISELAEVEPPAEPKKIRPVKLSIRNFDAWYGTKRALKGINLDVIENSITSFIGPSGCGKTTLIRCLNRMHEMTPGASTKGQAILDGMNMYDAKIDPVTIKRRIGMVFQKPNPFPTMSIYDNVAAGLKLNGIKDKKLIDDIVRESLEGAALWEEVKNELNKPGMGLSGVSNSVFALPGRLLCSQKYCLWTNPHLL